MLQSFRPTKWNKTPKPATGGPVRRIYLPQLDMMIKPKEVRMLLGESARTRARFVCRDTECCPHGLQDMIGHPARHAIYQRAREIERLSGTPQRVRAARFLEDYVQPASDNVAAIASLNGLDEQFKSRLARKHSAIRRFRHTMAHLANSAPSGTVAVPPRNRSHKKNTEDELPLYQGN